MRVSRVAMATTQERVSIVANAVDLPRFPVAGTNGESATGARMSSAARSREGDADKDAKRTEQGRLAR